MEFGQFAQELFVFSSRTSGAFENHLNDLIASVFFREFGTPRSRSLNFWLFCAWRNLQQSLAIDGGHFDLVPRPASHMVMGTSIWILSPSRRNTDVGFTLVVMERSPEGPLPWCLR